ncbi:hypothetical protein PG987_006037 [Apiospora arundinis]
MSDDTSSRMRSQKKRTNVACDFCRQRKLGCDNAKPKCENCHAHQRTCTYAVRIKKDRPSNTQINHLKDENAKLQLAIDELRRSLGTALRNAHDGHHAGSHADLHAPDLGVVPGVGDNLSPSYIHQVSPSATAYVWSSLKRKNNTRPVDETQKLQLLAEAAKQRQLEPINLRSKKLDFDGVDPQHGSVLLSVFWNRQHATGSAVYRPTFMRDMAAGGPYFSPLLLNAMFFVAAKHAPGLPGLDERAGMRFRRGVEEMLYDPRDQLICCSSITTAQALLLMSDALFSWCDERSLSWHYLGVAINMIVDLGIHCERSRQHAGSTEPPELLEVKRRLFWSAFVLDKIQSIYQGRPTRLRYTDNDVPIVFMDEYEELEPFNTLGYAQQTRTLEYPTHSVSAFENLCSLSIIADRILCSLYSEMSVDTEARHLHQICHHLQTELSQWKDSLPSHLAVSFDAKDRPSGSCVTLPHTLSLIVMYHALTILLHRPFVSGGHLDPETDAFTREALAHCDAAATQIDAVLRYYKTVYCIKSPPYFVSYATYVSATMHARIAATQPAGRPDYSVAHRRLRNCLEILSGHQELCHAPRRTLTILLKLMGRLEVDVGRVFVADRSRTQPCDISRTDGADELLRLEVQEKEKDVVQQQHQQQPRHSPSVRRSLPRMMLDDSHVVAVGDTGSSSSMAGARAAEPLQFEEEPISSGAMMGQEGSMGSDLPAFEYDLGELLPGISFDLDPLFGFDITEMDPS